MKSDEDVNVMKASFSLPIVLLTICKLQLEQMVAHETPFLFAKACELFIMELTLRTAYRTQKINHRKILKVPLISLMFF